MSNWSKWLVTALVIAATTVWSDGAMAQAERTPLTGVPFYEADKTLTFQATQFYKAGLAAQKRGRHEDALKAFRQSYGVVRSPNSRMMVVRELAELGRHVDAYNEAVECVAEAEEAAGADASKYGRTLEAANAELEAVKLRVALLVINVVGAPDGAALVVNGLVVVQADWGRPIPVEAGEAEVVLTTSEGELTETTNAVVGETVEVSIGKAQVVAPPPAPPPAPQVVDEGGRLWPADWPDRQLIAIIVGGTSVLSFINFGIFGLLSEGQADRVDLACPPPHQDCDPLLEAQADKGRTFQAVANTFLVIGLLTGVAAGGFLTWDILDPDEPAGTASARRGPKVTLGPGTLWVTGSF